jgi:flagellar hook protein FlgE
MDSFQTALDTIGNNIANANTSGYKQERSDFADLLSGSTISSSTTDFTQGTTDSTGASGDLAISGNGFFLVKDPDTGAEYVTRNGAFHLDTSGYLVTADGMRVQGYNDSSLSSTGDIQIDGTGTTTDSTVVSSYSIGTDGKITVTMGDNTSFVRGQVLLTSFQNPQALVREGSNLYSNITNAGQLTGAAGTLSAPGTSGLGTIEEKTLEASNVDLTAEFTNMITVQRGYQANARVITTSDEMLQEVINLKR